MPEVLEENVQAWEVFIACETQQRTAGQFGSIIGLDYGAVRWVMGLYGIPPSERPDVFERIRVLEAGLVHHAAEAAKAEMRKLESSHSKPPSRR